MKYNFYYVQLGNFRKMKPMKRVGDKIKYGKVKTETITDVIVAFGEHMDCCIQAQKNLKWRRRPGQMACFAGNTLVAVSNGDKITVIELDQDA